MALSELVIFILVTRAASADSDQPSELARVSPSKMFRAYKSNRRLADQVPLLRTDEPPIETSQDGRSDLTERTLDYDYDTGLGDPSSNSTVSPRSDTVDQDAASRGYLDRVEEDVPDDDEEVVEGDDEDEKHEGGGGHGAGHGGGHHKKMKKAKKKKKHHGFLSLMKKMKKNLPAIMHKMHGPSMFMMGMAHANFHNFVMHALMMSKMALTTVVMMILREMVFGDKDQPVKYYNFGYDHHHHHRRHSSPYDYKHRRKR